MSQFLIPRPRNGDGTVIPALLVALLGCVLVAQLAVAPPIKPVAPSAGPRPTGPVVPPPVMTAAIADPIIRSRPIFAPARAASGAGAGAGAAADPLAGSVISGTWSVGRQVNLVLRMADGQMRNMRVGQSANRWVLTSITSGGARFVRDGRAIVIPFGGAGPPSPEPQSSQSEEEQ